MGLDLQLNKDRELKTVEIYTDGGAWPNPGAAGYGVYGEVKYKGRADSNFAFTYSHPIAYDTSNNVAEMQAVQKAVECCHDNGIKNVTIHSDSEYAIRGWGKLKNWKIDGYFNRDGSEIKNKGEWQTAAKLHTKVSGTMNVRLKYVKGHNGIHGNEMADGLATQARILAGKKQFDETEFKITPFDESGKVPKEKLPKFKYNQMLMSIDWYFNLSEKEILKTEDGRFIYFGGKSPDDDAVGKAESETYYTLTYIKETVPVLDLIFDEQMRLNTRNESFWVTGRLNNILTSTGGATLERDGTKFLQVAGVSPSHRKEREKKGYSRGKANWRYKNDLINLKGVELTYIANPPRNTFCLWDYRAQMAQLLDLFDNGKLPEHICVTDITERIYEEEITYTKGKNPKEKRTVKVRKEVSNPNNLIPMEINHMGSIYKFDMMVGIEIPTRNNFSGLLKHQKEMPKVSIITVSHGDKAFRFHCVVELDGEITLWTARWSNLYGIGVDTRAKIMERFKSPIKKKGGKKGKKKKK